MYRYDDFDRQLVLERTEQFREQVKRRLSGDITEDQFRPLRLMNGVYLQLHAYMLRVAVPYGTLRAEQLRQLGYIARRYDEPPEVVNSIASHHNDVPMESIYAVITQIADSISGSRPGARGETLERYIKKLENLEAVALSFSGVKAANAIQAGREIRVFVNAQKIGDKKAVKLCRDIAKEIESTLQYPGEIKVTLLRETRVVEYAR